MLFCKHARVFLSVLFLVLFPGEKRKRDEVDDDDDDEHSDASVSQSESEGCDSSDDFDDPDDIESDEKWFSGERKRVDSKVLPDSDEEPEWKSKDKAAEKAEKWAVCHMDMNFSRKLMIKGYKIKFDDHDACYSSVEKDLRSLVADIPKETKERIEGSMTPRMKETWSFLPLVCLSYFWDWQKESVKSHVPVDNLCMKSLFRAIFFNSECGFGKFLIHFNFLPYLLSFHQRCMVNSGLSDSVVFDDMVRFSYRLADDGYEFLQGSRYLCSFLYVERCFNYIFNYKKPSISYDSCVNSSEVDKEVSSMLYLPTVKDLMNRVRRSVVAARFDQYCGLILLLLSMPGMFEVFREDSNQLTSFKRFLKTYLIEGRNVGEDEAVKRVDEIVDDILNRRYSDHDFISVAQGLVEHLFIRPFTRGVLFKLSSARQSRLEGFLMQSGP
ncbi:hypothetical protein GUITHDRAFT_120891 [Guillardia theta CCMP2712]|uniref:Uncharacterized protein n=1 Tax=Guillardia theta (strain CCMP2712) TaxID=905079 RepID=L1IAH8_GUITC|nr:hypothetical protein GUITHDRAFT_120891 [Guillardia theta CCMP2712]EKX32904.1 hypothetical protein GUITHDRAFT_120891 [Guillardia theta CCMP2712]|eukprot:XP_005819884.1 hypothetical protein GUITHDRAFT_120891 [Guillardia theta CCMP2712]